MSEISELHLGRQRGTSPDRCNHVTSQQISGIVIRPFCDIISAHQMAVQITAGPRQRQHFASTCCLPPALYAPQPISASKARFHRQRLAEQRLVVWPSGPAAKLPQRLQASTRWKNSRTQQPPPCALAAAWEHRSFRAPPKHPKQPPKGHCARLRLARRLGLLG